MIRHDDVNNIHMCDRFSNNCFHTKMENATYAKKSCYCLPKCNTIHFTHSEERVTLDIKKICNTFDHIGPRKAYKQLLSQDLIDFLEMSTDFDVYGHFLKGRKKYEINQKLNFYEEMDEFIESLYHENDPHKNVNEDKNDAKTLFDIKSCKRLFSKDVTIIEVQLMNKAYRKITQKLRVTFADQIGSIGGTLGLFCGFSFLAIVELLHWICIGIFKILNQKLRVTSMNK